MKFIQKVFCKRGSFHVKSTNPSHLIHMDFADILSSQWKSWKFYHLIMKAFKIMTAWTMDPLAWTTNHYNLWHFETALIQPVLIVNIWNFEWGLIFWNYLRQKKFWKLYLCWGAKIVKLTASIFFHIFSGL